MFDSHRSRTLDHGAAIQAMKLRRYAAPTALCFGALSDGAIARELYIAQPMHCPARPNDGLTGVIARLDQAIQYPRSAAT